VTTRVREKTQAASTGLCAVPQRIMGACGMHRAFRAGRRRRRSWVQSRFSPQAVLVIGSWGRLCAAPSARRARRAQRRTGRVPEPCAWLVLAGWPGDAWSEWRRPQKTARSRNLARVQRRGHLARKTCSDARSFRNAKRTERVCCQEWRLVLLWSSHAR